jgi:single-strand DNA-binding protein
MNVNKVIFAGRLTKDPRIGVSKAGTPILHFTLAVNVPFRDASGAKQREDLFLPCTAFGILASVLGDSIRKSTPLLVSGRLRTENFTRDDGTEVSQNAMVVESFEYVLPPQKKREGESQ